MPNNNALQLHCVACCPGYIDVPQVPYTAVSPVAASATILEKTLFCWFSAGNGGMTSINHPLWFPLRESPSGSFPTPWVVPYLSHQVVNRWYGPWTCQREVQTAYQRVHEVCSFVGNTAEISGPHQRHEQTDALPARTQMPPRTWRVAITKTVPTPKHHTSEFR